MNVAWKVKCFTPNILNVIFLNLSSDWTQGRDPFSFLTLTFLPLNIIAK